MSGVRSENARAGLTPDTRNLKPMLGEGFITPDNVKKKRAIFIVNYEACTQYLSVLAVSADSPSQIAASDV